MNRHTSMFRLPYLLCLGMLIQSCITDDEAPVASIIAANTSIRVSAVAGNDEVAIEASGTEWVVAEEIDWWRPPKWTTIHYRSLIMKIPIPKSVQALSQPPSAINP
ncbi:MAG: hypothetical protein OXH57_02285 [Ekhidna sp.]|nr:hypothetical protein [Ekhidna sp.]